MVQQAAMAMTTETTKTPAAVKVEGRRFNLKVKEADKWKTLGTAFLRADGSGGVATLYQPDGSKLENVAIFPVDGKFPKRA